MPRTIQNKVSISKEESHWSNRLKGSDLSAYSREDLEALAHALQAENEQLRASKEDKLQELQANLEAVIENTDDFIVSVDTSYRILVCNSAYRC
jgi:PAS domain-containing protein